MARRREGEHDTRDNVVHSLQHQPYGMSDVNTCDGDLSPAPPPTQRYSTAPWQRGCQENCDDVMFRVEEGVPGELAHV